MRNLSKLAAAAAGTVLGSVLSVSTLAEDTRHVDAHVHGAGHLNFAIEGNQVHLELETPGFDILGFETISTEAQHHQLEKALERLKTPELWVFTSAASCKLKTVSVSGGDNDHHDDHDSHDKEHGDDHNKHKGHGDHDKHEDHADHAEEGHMDIEATYVYECAHIKKLDSISTRLFEMFSNSEKLKVQGFTDKGQVAGSLSRKNPEVRL